MNIFSSYSLSYSSCITRQSNSVIFKEIIHIHLVRCLPDLLPSAFGLPVVALATVVTGSALDLLRSPARSVASAASRCGRNAQPM